MLTALCPPIRAKNVVSPTVSRVHGMSAMGFALYETKTITFTLTRASLLKWKAWVSRFFSQIVVPPFFGTKLWFKGGSPSWDPEKQFLSRSVLLKLIRFEWMSFSWKIGYRSWSQKMYPLRRCTKCSMLSVLSFNSPGIKLFSNKVHVGTFKEGTAFLGSDLGLRVLEMNLGPFKTERKVLGPWSLDFCLVSTLSIKNKTCARCSMWTTFGWTPLPEPSFFTQGCCSWAHFAWFRPGSVGK